MKHVYTDAEIAWLRKVYPDPSIPIRKIADMLGVATSNLSKACSKRGIHRAPAEYRAAVSQAMQGARGPKQPVEKHPLDAAVFEDHPEANNPEADCGLRGLKPELYRESMAGGMWSGGYVKPGWHRGPGAHRTTEENQRKRLLEALRG